MGKRTCVPDLQSHHGICVGVDHALGQETCANSRRDLGWIESAFAVSHDERGFPHALSAENDDLGLERRHGLFGNAAPQLLRGEVNSSSSRQASLFVDRQMQELCDWQ